MTPADLSVRRGVGPTWTPVHQPLKNKTKLNCARQLVCASCRRKGALQLAVHVAAVTWPSSRSGALEPLTSSAAYGSPEVGRWMTRCSHCESRATQWCVREVQLCAFKYEDLVVLVKSSKGKKNPLNLSNQSNIPGDSAKFSTSHVKCVRSSVFEHVWWFYMLLRNKLKTFLWCIQPVFVLLWITIVIQCHNILNTWLDLSLLFLTSPIKPGVGRRQPAVC